MILDHIDASMYETQPYTDLSRVKVTNTAENDFSCHQKPAKIPDWTRLPLEISESPGEYDFVEVVRLLVWYQATICIPSEIICRNAPGEDSTTAREAHVRIFRLILKDQGAMLHSKFVGAERRFPIQREAGDHEMLRILLEMAPTSHRKALLNDKGDSAGHSPIWWAAAGTRGCGSYEKIIAVLCQEADAAVQLDSISPEDETVIAVAAKKGHYRIVEILAATGTSLADMPDEIARTPLSLAAESGNGKPGSKVAQLLLQTGKVNVESTSDSGYTLL